MLEILRTIQLFACQPVQLKQLYFGRTVHRTGHHPECLANGGQCLLYALINFVPHHFSQTLTMATSFFFLPLR